MKKGGILNPAICSLLAELGHMDELLIVDAAYPLPPDGHVIDLTLTPGIPRFLDVLRAVAEELVIESITVASEMSEYSPKLYQEVLKIVGDVDVDEVPHHEFKEQSLGVKGIIRTAEFTPYANVRILSGSAIRDGEFRMSSGPQLAATLDDLYRVEGKAELIGGRIVPILPTGYLPNRVAGRIFRSLAGHVDVLGRGVACSDNMGFAVPELSSGRQSFSPDVSYYFGPLPANLMRFIEGPPTLAVEVRSEGDYGASAEAEIAAKRGDYWEAGTQVVWDMDPIAGCILVYRAPAPDQPERFSTGQEVDAEPVVPGWRVAIDWIFDFRPA